MTKSSLRIPLAIATIAASVAVLSGCSSIGKSLTDTYLITYEVTAEGGDGILPHVEMQESPSRGEASALVVRENQNLKSSSAGSTWSDDVLVSAGDKARVVVPGQDGVTLTCRILVDKKTVLDSQTGAAGSGVECGTETEPFS